MARSTSPGGGPEGGPDHDEPRRIAVVGSYVPRRCGIATFTTGLAEALHETALTDEVAVIAMNDQPRGYDYPARVVLEVDADRLEDYHLAANFVNTQNYDLLVVQHEFGIYGGQAGSHLLTLLRQAKVPIVTTLHTVLARPNEQQRRVTAEMCRLVDDFIVMNPRSGKLLAETYGADPERVHLVHHGVPDVPLVDPDDYKTGIDAKGRKVLLTFGLLSPGKGIEYMIEGMPAVAEGHADALYIILGRTHPHVVREAGETYRTKLQRLAAQLGVEENVRFQDEFVSLTKLFEYLRAADLYITPYLNLDQAVSGTLAYAMAAGKAIVSTPYSHAEVMLKEGRGRLVPPRDAGALADACRDLLSNPRERARMRRAAYDFSRQMTWPEVAKQYLTVAAEAARRRRARPEAVILAVSPEGAPLGLQESPLACPLPPRLPSLDLDHLRAMTDDTGMIQHARYTVPNRHHGYSTDDNARALIAVVLAKYVRPDDPTLARLAMQYVAFLDYAFNAKTGRFRNFMTYDRRWLEPQGSEDSHGRSLWALGTAVALDQNEGHRMLAAELFRQALPAERHFRSPRAHAFTVLGLRAYLEWFESDDPARQTLRESSRRLLKTFREGASDDWPWCEDILTYTNAKLPHALIVAGRVFDDEEMIETGLRSLTWLMDVQRDENDCFSPVGNAGWYPRGGEKARYDQQPVEAHASLEACLAAHEATHEAAWLDQAQRTFEWFLGRNDMLWPLYDASTGGCRDGLSARGINQNEGAESTLAWLLSLLRMQLHRSAAVAQPGVGKASTGGRSAEEGPA